MCENDARRKLGNVTKSDSSPIMKGAFDRLHHDLCGRRGSSFGAFASFGPTAVEATSTKFDPMGHVLMGSMQIGGAKDVHCAMNGPGNDLNHLIV